MTDKADDRLDFLAWWWLPDRTDRRVPGRLTWDPDGGGDLDLIGELREPAILDHPLPSGDIQKYRHRHSTRDRRYPLIHGSRIDSSGREVAYTLLDSFSLNNIGFHSLTTEHPEHISTGAVLRGAWYTDPADIEADRAIFDIRHLTTWIATQGLDTRYPILDGDIDGPYAVVTGHHLADYTSNFEGAAQIIFEQDLNPLNDQRNAAGIEETWRLVIKIEPMGQLDRFTDIATDIRALITIAAGKTADIEKAVLQHPTLHAYRGDGTAVPAFREDITYLNRWAHRGTDTSEVRPHELYFNLEKFGGPDVVERWLRAATTYRTELRRVMATRYTDAMYLEDRIINTCAALERFDKVRRANTAPKVMRNGKLRPPAFVDRIEECIRFAGAPAEDLIVDNPREWAQRLRDARNQLAHHDDPFRATGHVGNYVLAEQAYWLFGFCLLRSCAAPEACFESISEHRQIQWLTSRAEAALALRSSTTDEDT